MKSHNKTIYSFSFILIIFFSCQNIGTNKFGLPPTEIRKGDYFGEKLPGDEPVVFAPGIISNGLTNRDVAITPDGDEMYFGISGSNRFAIVVSKRKDGIWSAPEIADFSGSTEWYDFEPHISPDGKKFFFLSTRPPEGKEPKPGWSYQDIWVMDREGDSWGNPYNIGSPINTDESEYFPSSTLEGTLYFTRGSNQERISKLYRSKYINGKYEEPELLPPEVNINDFLYNAFIALDENYIIFCTSGLEDAIGNGDYYISFRDSLDNWTPAKNMGAPVNMPNTFGVSPYVSPDGKYFFFSSNRALVDSTQQNYTLEMLINRHTNYGNGSSDIYWMKSDIILSLKPAF